MKLKDLPESTPITTVKVKLPEHIYSSSSLPIYKIKNVPVYLIGWVMGDFMVKVKKNSTQVYPMFWHITPGDILEWEVAD